MEFDLTYFGALTAGLISFVSPCVLPIVPPYLCFLAGLSLDQITADGQEAPGARRKVVFSSVAFVFGFATVFVALGATASVIGQTMARNLDWLAVVAGAMILVLGLHFTGLIRIPLLYREARFDVERKPPGLLGAYLVGLAFAFGWTPCVGPVLATILFTAGGQETAAEGALLLSFYALGIGVPFVLAAFFVGPFMMLMRRFRRHMGMVEKVMGILLIATGVLFMTGQMRVIAEFMLDYIPAKG